MEFLERWSYRIALAGALFWLCQPVRNYDVWWHLATGRWMWSVRHIPRLDVFSSTMRGHAWIDHEWLYELILYAFYAAGGLTGVLIIKLFLILGAVIIVWRRLIEAEIPPAAALIVAGAAFWASRYAWSDRADLASVFFISLLFRCFDSWHRHGEDWTFWASPLLFAVWANVHGGFVLGLACAGIFVFAHLWRGQGEESKLSFRSLCLWFAACAAATLLNPYGLRLHRSIWQGLLVLNSGLIQEWQRTPWRHLELFWLCLGLFWATIAVKMWRRSAISAYMILESAFLTWAAVSHVRNLPYFMIAAFPYCAPHSLPDRLRKPLLAGLLPVLLIWSCGAAAQIKGGIRKDMFPIEACDFIEAANLRGRFYADYALGGYWIWRFGERLPVFIDGRLHSVEGYIPLWEEIQKTRKQSPEDWNRFLDRYGVDGALVGYPGQPQAFTVLNAYFPPKRWVVAYSDKRFTVYLRREASSGRSLGRRVAAGPFEAPEARLKSVKLIASVPDAHQP